MEKRRRAGWHERGIMFSADGKELDREHYVVRKREKGVRSIVKKGRRGMKDGSAWFINRGKIKVLDGWQCARRTGVKFKKT